MKKTLNRMILLMAGCNTPILERNNYELKCKEFLCSAGFTVTLLCKSYMTKE